MSVLDEIIKRNKESQILNQRIETPNTDASKSFVGDNTLNNTVFPSSPSNITGNSQGGSQISQPQEGKTSVTEQKPAKTESDEPRLSDYQKNQQMLEQFLVTPMTPEEEERRKRSASAIAGIGNLGNVFNAFSNLVYTGKGAPSQELPKTPDGNLQSFEDRIKAQRENYLQQKQRGRAMDLNEYNQAYNNWQQNKAREAAERYNQQKLDQTNAQFRANLGWKTWNAEQGDKTKRDIADENNRVKTRIADRNNATKWSIHSDTKYHSDTKDLVTFKTKNGKVSISKKVYDENIPHIYEYAVREGIINPVYKGSRKDENPDSPTFGKIVKTGTPTRQQMEKAVASAQGVSERIERYIQDIGGTISRDSKVSKQQTKGKWSNTANLFK